MTRTVLSKANGLVSVPDWLPHALLYYDHVARFMTTSQKYTEDAVLDAWFDEDRCADSSTTALVRKIMEYSGQAPPPRGVQRSDLQLLADRSIIKTWSHFEPSELGLYDSVYARTFERVSSSLAGVTAQKLQGMEFNVPFCLPVRYASALERTLAGAHVPVRWMEIGGGPMEEVFCLVSPGLAIALDDALEEEISAAMRAPDETVIAGYSTNPVDVADDVPGLSRPVLQLVWRDLFPAPVNGTPINKILGFKDEYYNERELFLDEIESLCRELSAMEPKAWQSRIERFNRSKKDGLRALSAAMTKYGLQTRTGYYASLLPIAHGLGQAVAKGAADQQWQFEIAAGVILAGVSYLRGLSERRALFETSPFGYVYMATKRRIVDEA